MTDPYYMSGPPVSPACTPGMSHGPVTTLFRGVASGTESLTHIAGKAGVTVADIIHATENSDISSANLSQFRTYLGTGINTAVPRGTVYYTQL